MKKLNLLLLAFFLVTGKGQAQQISQAELYKKVVGLDSLFFQAYNNCDMETQKNFYNDTIEFFHDKGGLETSKEKILADTRKYICGKVQRILVNGSIEVSPVPGYGAIEIGQHRFHNLSEKSVSRPSKFVIVWKNDNGKWTMTKVISLH
ncbi:MAG: nuclear transport factor 2 family protein [Chitinophagaceae bacterium]